MSESNNARRVPQFLAELADVTARVISSRLEATSEQAAQVGMEVARTVSREFAGELLYVAKGTGLDTDDRDRALLQFYLANNRNIQATAKEFGLCVQQAYRRIRQLQAADAKDRQPPLFPDA